ncbi:sensor histidine kinase [Parafrankia sp. BMG5.11]|uniref:sensor histidine kinase n=1 Tax=Parafrankia sp. BMG5.11 TaxID=222540 RepID=UPI001FB3010F|nr:sensor histidine kinase [Parafrankia sp. BMG5.11]
MQRVRSVQSEEARGHLEDAHHRVMSVATLQRQLAKSASGDVALRPYLTDLFASIAASMIFDPDMVGLTVDADNSVMSADRAVSIGLTVAELVINSLKHAYPDLGRKGSIRIAFETTTAGWMLTLADDGIGIPDDHASGKPGLGTGIVNALAKQLAATVEVTDAKPGCVVTVIHR